MERTPLELAIIKEYGSVQPTLTQMLEHATENHTLETLFHFNIDLAHADEFKQKFYFYQQGFNSIVTTDAAAAVLSYTKVVPSDNEDEEILIQCFNHLVVTDDTVTSIFIEEDRVIDTLVLLKSDFLKILALAKQLKLT